MLLIDWFWFLRTGTKRTCGLDRHGVFLYPGNPDLSWPAWGKGNLLHQAFSVILGQQSQSSSHTQETSTWPGPPHAERKRATPGNIQNSGSLVSFPDLPKEQAQTCLLTSAQGARYPLGEEAVSCVPPSTWRHSKSIKLTCTERILGCEMSTPTFSQTRDDQWQKFYP